MDRIDYNTVYRNFPGWFYGDDDTVKKAHDAKEAKKPIIPAIKQQGDSNGTRKGQDAYDREGSNLRNDIRRYTYNRYGGKEVVV